MRSSTAWPVLLLLSLGCAGTSPFGLSGPPRSEALNLAAEDLACPVYSLLTQVKEDHLVVTGCDATAAYAVVGGTWQLRLRHKNGGWIFSRALFKEDLDVFKVASRELNCDPHQLWLERQVGVRVARGCGFGRGYAVVCNEVHGFPMDRLPRYGSATTETLPNTDPEALRKAGEARPFDGSMTRPEKICGRDPVYSQLSLQQRAQGLAIIKCVITEEGLVETCRVVKPLQYHTEVFVDAVYTQRFKPATFEGVPVRVDYVFNVRALLPQ